MLCPGISLNAGGLDNELTYLVYTVVQADVAKRDALGKLGFLSGS
jgi:hypothetical protein